MIKNIIIFILLFITIYNLYIPSCPHIPTLVNCANKNFTVLNGTDVVNLYNFNDNYLKGNKKYKSTYMGYTYLFHNMHNKILFENNPIKYIPQYGGFCSWGIADEYKPSFVWSKNCLGPAISLNSKFKYKGKLYLFLAKKPYDSFIQNPDKYIQLADKRYSKWYKPGEYMNTTCVFQDYNKLILKL